MRTLNEYFREKYGHRIHKITISLPFSCPNKDGSISSYGCWFCREGSIPDGNDFSVPLESQIKLGIKRGKKRYGKKTLFMAYFQTGTNTYAPLSELKKTYDSVAEFPEVIGIDIGTRPDCVDRANISLLQGYMGKLREVWIELGLQSSNESTLKRINRGHTAKDYLKAADLITRAGINMCAHMIIGLPGETIEDYKATMEMIIESGAHAVKIHPFHILKGTAAEKDYIKSPYRLLSLHEYAEALALCIKMMPKDMILMRFHGEAGENVLVAPSYCLPKKREEVKEALRAYLEKG